MSIPNFIKKICVQPAVYWGSPEEDGFGNKIFANPVEILVRWEEKQRLVTALNGKEITSKASILSPVDLDIEGYIYLGTLASLYDYPESDYLDSDDSSYLDSDDSSYLDSDDSSYLDSNDSSYYESSEEVKHPKEVDGAFEILAVDKTPLFKSKNKFVREYFLGFKNV